MLKNALFSRGHSWNDLRLEKTFLHFCVCVFLFLLHIDYHHTHSTSKVRTSVGNEDSLAGPGHFKGMIEG